MAATTISSRQFTRDASGAAKAAQAGPVFITDHGRPAHVLMTMEEYERLTGKSQAALTLADLLAIPAAEDVDFDPPRLQGPFSKPADLS